jgi:hypothetical protein
MRSSGASWVPSRETQGRARLSAKARTKEDFPMPGAPHRKTGRTVAVAKRRDGSWDGVTVVADCIVRSW